MNVKLEIGCGIKSRDRDDFIGLDRFQFPGVDVVCNLDDVPIPFPDNHLDLVYASHSLEHVSDLLAVMREIWRVSKPGAQLCILAPYYANTVNFANPYHLQAFNEHTPRFWTNNETSAVDPLEYVEHNMWKQGWGLAQSDNSNLGFDFRCNRIEFFYYPQYSRMLKSKVRELRRTRNNICHSLLYHLEVFKGPMFENSQKAHPYELYIPPEVTTLRKVTKKVPFYSMVKSRITNIRFNTGR